jgi:23S rRNA (uracil1939-C5)-methyltransferase
MARRHRSKQKPKQNLSQKPIQAVIDSLSHEGRGVAHIDGKATFISGALPGEKVSFIYILQKRNHAEGVVKEIIEPSPDRVEPKCPHYAICGGCSLQHLSSEAQIKYKQKSMLDGLKHIGKVEPKEIFDPITGDLWAYRSRARLGVRYVAKQDKVLIGFRQRQGKALADMDSCEVLPQSIGKKLHLFQTFIYKLESRDSISQIEVAIGDDAIALIVRHLKPLSGQDQTMWIAFAKEHGYQLYLQAKGPESIHCVYSEDKHQLYFHHKEFNCKIHFKPQDFFQVNASINRQMVPRVLQLLNLTGTETVLDLFCGLGNFTLPIARNAKHVTGIEGDLGMVNRARQMATVNGVTNSDYFVSNLMAEAKDLKSEPWLKKKYDCIVLDPPRSGAKEIIQHFGKLKAKRIVYISCHPATLARDAGELVHTHGYKLVGAGVMDMFPQTAHVESIAVFERM